MDSEVKKENEKKKEYLLRYRYARKKQEAIEKEIEELRLERMSPSGLRQDGMPHGSDCSDLSGYAADLDELLEELKDQMEEKIRIRREISAKIEEMEDESESLLLRLRYIHEMKWEQVAEKMEYSLKQTHRIHGNALKNLKMT